MSSPNANLPVPRSAPSARPAARCCLTPPTPGGRTLLQEGSTERLFASGFLNLEPEAALQMTVSAKEGKEKRRDSHPCCCSLHLLSPAPGSVHRRQGCGRSLPGHPAAPWNFCSCFQVVFHVLHCPLKHGRARRGWCQAQSWELSGGRNPRMFSVY